MRNLRVYFKILLLYSIFLSCAGKKKFKPHNRQFEGFNLDTKDVASLKLESGSPMTYNIPDSGKVTKIDSIFKHVRYLMLEKKQGSIIGQIDKVYLDSTKIFVVDKQYTKSVFVFDREGKFLSKISPGSLISKSNYSTITSANVFSSKNLIIIFDNKLSKLFYFDLNCNFIKSEGVGLRFSEFKFLDNETLILFSADSQNDHIPLINHYSLFSLRNNNKVISKDFYIPTILNDFPLFGPDHLTADDTSIYFFPRFTDTVFTVLPGGRIKAIYKFSVKNLMPVEFLYNDVNRKMFFNKIANSNYSYFMGNFYQNSTHIITSINRGGKMTGQLETIIIDRRSGKVANISEVSFVSNKKIAYPSLRRPLFVFKDEFVAALPQSALKPFRDLKSKEVNSKISISTELAKLLSQNSAQGNPILMFYTLRDIK